MNVNQTVFVSRGSERKPASPQDESKEMFHESQGINRKKGLMADAEESAAKMVLRVRVRPGRCIRSFSWTGRSRTRMHKRVRWAGVPPGSVSGSSGKSCSTSCRSSGFPRCFLQQVWQNQTCSMRLEAMDKKIFCCFRQVFRPGGEENAEGHQARSRRRP